MKSIPIQLKAHYNTYATTWCYLMRVACKKGKYDGVVRGFTSLDWPVKYNDGQGELSYSSDNGFAPSKFQNTADFGVDNTDMKGWVQDDGITEEDIFAGIFDGAEVVIYRVNYNDLTPGRHEIVNFGTFGQTEFGDTSWKCEFRSLMQRAKQPSGEVYSLTCRNQFGDKKCKKAFVWITGTVTNVGDDPQLVIQSDDLTQDDGYFAPGVLEATSGLNNGADMDVDMFFEGGLVRLALRMPLQFQVGDTFRIRIDCDKEFETCRDVHDNVLEFRGEHLTPVADTGLQVPGAYIRQENAS